MSITTLPDPVARLWNFQATVCWGFRTIVGWCCQPVSWNWRYTERAGGGEHRRELGDTSPPMQHLS